jgi:phosphoribosylanthranilate isomerase
LDEFPAAAFLLDAYCPHAHGGTGKRFAWEHAVAAKAYDKPIILAGGLTKENVAEAIRIVRPYAVDVSSGVEQKPGKKDRALIREFIEKARSVTA